jgi:RNA polymerase sigma-70 factor (ECF subfamily)
VFTAKPVLAGEIGSHAEFAYRDNSADSSSVALDETQMEKMLREHGGAVRCTLAKRYFSVLGSADIDDILAVATHKAWRFRERFDPEKGSLRTWFFRIADNVARDVLRVGWFKARQLEIVAEKSYLEALPAPDGGELSRRPDSAAAEAIREILAGLPVNQRRIVWADALAGTTKPSSRDLARELGLTVGSVRVYRAKAMRKIREELVRRNLHPHPTDDHE